MIDLTTSDSEIDEDGDYNNKDDDDDEDFIDDEGDEKEDDDSVDVVEVFMEMKVDPTYSPRGRVLCK